MKKHFDHLAQFQNRILRGINLDYGPAEDLIDAEPLGIQLEFQGIDNLLAINLRLSTDTIGIQVSPKSESHPKSLRSSGPPFSRLVGQPLTHLFMDYEASSQLTLSSDFPGTAVTLTIISACLQFKDCQLEVTDNITVSEASLKALDDRLSWSQIF